MRELRSKIINDCRPETWAGTSALLDRVDAYLLASQSPRPGYRLVAEEPTPEMVLAGTEAAVKSVWQCDDAVKLSEARRELTRTIYKAMLSASPLSAAGPK